ncbi:hypothetical protein GCM10020256_04710 [Streptomyces thermocoprophilus]
MGLNLLRGTTRRGLPRVVIGASAALCLGLVAGAVWRADTFIGNPLYGYLALLLLSIGLYGSTHGIDLSEARGSLRVVLVAVTAGVVLKAALIGAVMVLAFHRVEYLVLGIAVAQIDPLSVAAMQDDKRVSPRAKAILSIWASFDDPMTVLLTVYVSALTIRLGADGDTSGSLGADTADVFGNLLLNLLLFAAVTAVWTLIRLAWLLRRRSARAAGGAGEAAAAPRSFDVLALLLVAVLVAVAASTTLVLAVALTGLVVRLGRFARVLDGAVTLAFLVASALLGGRAVGADPCVSGRGARGERVRRAVRRHAAHRAAAGQPPLSPADRAHLGLGQQNGITAILLALSLEPTFHGTVAVVGPAVVTVNLLHFAFRWARRDRPERPVPRTRPGLRRPLAFRPERLARARLRGVPCPRPTLPRDRVPTRRRRGPNGEPEPPGRLPRPPNGDRSEGGLPTGTPVPRTGATPGPVPASTSVQRTEVRPQGEDVTQQRRQGQHDRAALADRPPGARVRGDTHHAAHRLQPVRNASRRRRRTLAHVRASRSLVHPGARDAVGGHRLHTRGAEDLPGEADPHGPQNPAGQ